MRKLRRRTVAAAAFFGVVLLGLSGSSWAKTARTRAKAAVHAVHSTAVRGTKRAKAHPVVAMHGEEVVPGVMPVETPLTGTAAENTGLNLTDQAAPNQTIPNQTAANSALPAQIAAVKAAPELTPASLTQVEGKPYTLRLSNLHTGETLNIVYRI